MNWHVLLVQSARHLSVLMTLRAMPFAIVVAASSRRTPVVRAAVGLGYLLVPALAYRLGGSLMVAWILIGALYYLALACSVPAIARAMARGRITRGGLFVIAAFTCLLLPGALASGAANGTFLVVGWELLFRIYSYCIETTRPGRVTPSLMEALFFLLVNPMLVYSPRRVRPVRRSSLSLGMFRALRGCVVIFVNAAFLRPLAVHLRSDGLPLLAVLTLPAYAALRVVSEYAAHSALADVQIGFMHQVGWTVPERYQRPWLAESPLDFWKRWNTYVQVWLETYVFEPFAKRVYRATHNRLMRLAPIVLTLFASGALHDLYTIAGHQRFYAGSTLSFLAGGAFALIWQLVRASTISVAKAVGNPRAFRRAGRFSAHAAMAAALGAAALWGR